jgi:hypothetical protein
MSRPGAASLWEQLAFGLLGPPIMAILFRFMARGWAMTVQGGTVSNKTVKRQRIEFWGMLIAMYVLVLGEFIYAWLI